MKQTKRWDYHTIPVYCQARIKLEKVCWIEIYLDSNEKITDIDCINALFELENPIIETTDYYQKATTFIKGFIESYKILMLPIDNRYSFFVSNLKKMFDNALFSWNRDAAFITYDKYLSLKDSK